MHDKHTRQRAARLRRAGALGAVGSVLTAGTLLTSAQSGQEGAPAQQFKGQIGLRAADSKSDFPQPVQAPKGAPNVVVILMDDVGFGATSTFGGRNGIVFSTRPWATCSPSTLIVPVPPLPMPPPSCLKSKTIVCLPGVRAVLAARL